METNTVLAIVGLIAGSGWGAKTLHVLMETRDSVRDALRDVGTKHPPTGLFQQVNELSLDTDEHRDWLIRAGLDRRSIDRRPPS